MKLPLFFISDIHLSLKNSEEENKKRNFLIDFIHHVTEKKGSLFIVGDLFDFWFEYKYVMPKAYFDILAAFHQARSEGVDIYFIPGNHDYWTRDFAEKTIFTKVFHNGFTLETDGKRFLITHGDGLLTRDTGYRIIKKLFRNKVFVFLYRCLHPDLGYMLAQLISRTGNHNPHSEEYNQSVIKELKEIAQNHKDNGIDYIIMGHYHQTKMVDLGHGFLIVLGDWIRFHSFGYFDGNEFSLNYWR